jgi:transposase
MVMVFSMGMCYNTSDMKRSNPSSTTQLKLFDVSHLYNPDSIKPLVELAFPSNQKYKLERHMSKFKPLREFGSPLTGLSPESFLDYINKELPEDDLCRIVNEVVFLLDTEEIECKYCLSGQNSYHPKLLLNILFYGYATGIRSSRKLADKCGNDFAYIFLMQCYTPDHRTISDFRKDNVEEIVNYFVDILCIFDQLGYKKLGKLYIDGVKLKANASSKRTKDKQGYEKWLSGLVESIGEILKEAEEIDKREDENYRLNMDNDAEQEELKKKLANRQYLRGKIETAIEVLKEDNDKKKLNLTDSDANYMKSGGSKDIRSSYNCQTAVTEEGIITACEAVTISNDQAQLKPMIEQSESNTSIAVKEVCADSNYGTYSSYEYLEEKKIDGYVPDGQFPSYVSGEYEKEENRYHYSNFKYDENDDSYICPESNRLRYEKTRKKKKNKGEWNYKVYKGVECHNCLKRSLCTKTKYRRILIEFREPLLNAMREKLLSKDGKSKYFMRQYIIEPIFGHLKYNLGYSHFLLRGLKKVNGELKLMCIGWNLKKLLKLGFTAQMVSGLRS